MFPLKVNEGNYVYFLEIEQFLFSPNDGGAL